MLLSQADYQMLMGVLSGNLSEGKQSEPSPRPAPKVVPTESRIVQVSQFALPRGSLEDVVGSPSQKIIDDKVHIFLKFNFTMESFIIDLFTGAAKTVCKCFFLRFKNCE